VPLIAFTGTVRSSDCIAFIGRKILTEDINWDVHVKHLSSKFDRSYYVLQSLEGKTSVNILRNIYFANIHSHIICSTLFWGSDGESKKMLKLQKTVMRLISNVGRDTSCRVFLKTLNILPVPCVHIMEVVYCTKMSIVRFEQNSVRHNYNICHRSDLQSQFCTADIKQKNCK